MLFDQVDDEVTETVDGPWLRRAWFRLEPHLPKIGAFTFVLTAFSVPVLTHGDMLSSPAALVILIASAGLFFACTWTEFRDI